MVTYAGMTSTDGVMLYVNGQRIGTRWRFNQWGPTLLRQGDNVVFAVLSNLDRDWRAGMQVEPMAPLAPGELIAGPRRRALQGDGPEECGQSGTGRPGPRARLTARRHQVRGVVQVCGGESEDIFCSDE